MSSTAAVVFAGGLCVLQAVSVIDRKPPKILGKSREQLVELQVLEYIRYLPVQVHGFVSPCCVVLGTSALK